ncbi:HU family DNA-binding protein [Streptomyces sp. B21-104]|uniref:HU family DNA-binding protein n=1 Tax=Streptomyces sp. B21-104 TaxID=3039421 RepID=UPI0030CEC3B9
MREPTLNKQELIDAIADAVDSPVTTVSSVLDVALQAIQSAVAHGDSVQLIGFGEFHAQERSERTARNPRTGEAMTIAAGRIVKFTAARAFKDAVNA